MNLHMSLRNNGSPPVRRILERPRGTKDSTIIVNSS